jgi:hypothetical protein
MFEDFFTNERDKGFLAHIDIGRAFRVRRSLSSMLSSESCLDWIAGSKLAEVICANTPPG